MCSLPIDNGGKIWYNIILTKIRTAASVRGPQIERGGDCSPPTYSPIFAVIVKDCLNRANCIFQINIFILVEIIFKTLYTKFIKNFFCSFECFGIFVDNSYFFTTVAFIIDYLFLYLMYLL